MLVRGLVLAAGLAMVGSGWAQAQVSESQPTDTAAVPQLSPQAAYEQAMRPLDITRSAMANWSDAEKNALGVAVKLAGGECDARHAEQFAGEGLLSFVRLCAFGWRWNTVQVASMMYINLQRKAAPEDKGYSLAGLTQVYAYRIKASLSLNDADTAFFSSRDMLREVPYSDIVSQASGAAIRYLQIIRTGQARALAAQRYVLLCSLLREQGKPETAAAQVPVHQLYADAIDWPAMMQFNKEFDPDAVVADLEKTLPAQLSSDDAILTSEARRRYKLLGAPVPTMSPSAYLADARFALPDGLGHRFGSATVYLLFPDWCAQCVRMGTAFSETAVRLNKLGANFFALLAQDGPAPAPPAPAKPAAAGKGKAARAPEPSIKTLDRPQTAAELLVNTPTLIVPRATLKEFVADDFPWLVVTDGQGVIRFVQAAPENALEANSLVDQVVARVMTQWPVSPQN